MIDSVSDYSLFMLDPQGLIVTWNLGAERLKGYLASEVIGRHFSVFYDAEAIKNKIPQGELEVAATAGRYEAEGLRLRKDGSSFWAHVVITALRRPDGALAGFGKITQDLSCRRLAELSLRESDARATLLAAELATTNSYLRNVLDAAGVIAIITTDLKGMITTFNRGAELMLGYTSDEVIRRYTPALFHVAAEVKQRGQVLSARLNRPIRGFEVFTSSIGLPEFEHTLWQYVHKDGHTLQVRLSLGEVHGADGRAVGFLGIAEDVTEQNRTAQALELAYDRVASVLECTSDSVMTIGHDWNLLYGNRKTIESLPDFKVGASYWTCFPGTVGTETEQNLRVAMNTRSEIKFENYYVPYAQWYRVHAFPSDDGLTIFFSIITEEKKRDEQLSLEQLLREKRIEALSHMAGGLSHEISNPLAIIHGRASDLRLLATTEQPMASIDVLRSCDSILQHADRAIKILKGLRGFGREASKDPMRLASINEIVSQCIELQGLRFRRHNIDLRTNLASDLPDLACREVQIGQIVTNLLNNAFDALTDAYGPPRWICLATYRIEDCILIDVTDSGPGVEDKFKAHLMEPFFTTKEHALGTGIGLSLSRAIAQDHAGSLILCNDTKNTCFRLTLPLVTRSLESKSEKATPEVIH